MLRWSEASDLVGDQTFVRLVFLYNALELLPCLDLLARIYRVVRHLDFFCRDLISSDPCLSFLVGLVEERFISSLTISCILSAIIPFCHGI